MTAIVTHATITVSTRIAVTRHLVHQGINPEEFTASIFVDINGPIKPVELGVRSTPFLADPDRPEDVVPLPQFRKDVGTVMLRADATQALTDALAGWPDDEWDIYPTDEHLAATVWCKVEDWMAVRPMQFRDMTLQSVALVTAQHRTTITRADIA